jgi:hypothetical protein
MITAIEKLEALFYNEADPTINSNSWVIYERTLKKLILAAKEMEKYQIIDAYNRGFSDGFDKTKINDNYYNEAYQNEYKKKS